MSQSLSGFYVSFSGEASKSTPTSEVPINNIYALSPKWAVVSNAVLGAPTTSNRLKELRGMSFGPDGKLYVAQANKNASAILQFSDNLAKNSYTRRFLGTFVTSSISPGLLHPYQPAFDSTGNLFVSSQDTNVVSSYYGPMASNSGNPMPSAVSNGTFYPGTFVPAFSYDTISPSPQPTSVPVAQGGLTFLDLGTSTHSVRGIAFDNLQNLYVADEGNDRVSVFNKSGAFLGAVTNSKSHSLSAPVGLCFDNTHKNLLIGSTGNNSLFKFDVSQVANGDFTANFLFSDSKLEKISGIATDPSGNIYTGNRKKNVIYQWNANGTSSSEFAGPFTDTPEQFIAVYTAIVGS